MSNTFNDFLKIDVSKNVEPKGKFKYLSWTFAWAELKKAHPTANYKVRMFDGKPYLKDGVAVMVMTEVTVGDLTHEMWLYAKDNYNNDIKNPSMGDINTALMRCLVKNIAMFGLGLSLYAGEDLPADEDPEEKLKPKLAVDEEPLTELFLTQVAEMTDLAYIKDQGALDRPENEKKKLRAQYAKVAKAEKEAS